MRWLRGRKKKLRALKTWPIFWGSFFSPLWSLPATRYDSASLQHYKLQNSILMQLAVAIHLTPNTTTDCFFFSFTQKTVNHTSGQTRQLFLLDYWHELKWHTLQKRRPGNLHSIVQQNEESITLTSKFLHL